MKILVFSDSHHEINNMIYVIENENPDIVIHLGDNINDAIILKDIFPKIAFEIVRGNCDFENSESEKIFDIENTKFFLCHGHKYRVKNTLDKLIEKGNKIQADIILFGHTHESYIDYDNDVWIINPGCINTIYKRDCYTSYAKISIENNMVNCEIVKRR